MGKAPTSSNGHRKRRPYSEGPSLVLAEVRLADLLVPAQALRVV
jgi:hypothetical protein